MHIFTAYFICFSYLLVRSNAFMSKSQTAINSNLHARERFATPTHKVKYNITDKSTLPSEFTWGLVAHIINQTRWITLKLTIFVSSKKHPDDVRHDGLPGSQDCASTPSRAGNPWKCCVMLAEGINHHHWSECLSRRCMWHYTASHSITLHYTESHYITL